jgi:hypothetical protein
MNVKQGIFAGVIAYASHFTALSFLSGFLAPIVGTYSWAGTAWQGIVILVTVAIVFASTVWYFKKTGIQGTFVSGLKVGVIIAIVGFLITMTQELPAVLKGGVIVEYFTNIASNWLFFLSLGITIASATAAGFWKSMK